MGKTEPRPGSERSADQSEHEAILRSAAVHDADAMIVVLDGELDLSTAPSLYAELQRLLALAPTALVLDLGRVTFIDSTGVSVLNTTRQHALETGIRFAIQAPSRAVAQVLEITALWEHFDRTPSRFEDAAFEW